MVDAGMIELSEEASRYFDYEKYGDDWSNDLHNVDGHYFWYE